MRGTNFKVLRIVTLFVKTNNFDSVNATRRPLFGKYVRTVLLTVDWIFFNFFFGLTLYLFNDGIFTTPWAWLMVNASFIPVLAFESRRSVSESRAIELDHVLRYTLNTIGIHALFLLSLTTLFDTHNLGAQFYVSYYVMLGVAVALWTLLSRHVIKKYRRRGMNFAKVVIVGTNTTARRLYEAMHSDPGYGYKVLGFFDHEWRQDFELPYCGSIDDLEAYVSDHDVDQVFFTIPGHDDVLSRVIKIADDNVMEFFYVPQISRYISRDFQMENIGAVPVLSIRRNPLKKAVNRALKRSFDIAVSSFFLLFYPLIYIPIALAIKLTSPGPIYFKQQRSGYKGKPFGCYKFRTMHVNVDSDRAQATKDDPRKTKLGDLLRRTSLDELPQFINVFKGDMSIVGPRPHMLRHTEEYSKLVDQYMVRHLLKPGITGWAQVNGYRGPTDELWKMEKRVEYDVWYIEHWTFLLDLKIMARTVLNAIHGEENAF